MQVQDAALFEALQAVRILPFDVTRQDLRIDDASSFELGGEKKTKGAALTFVRTVIAINYDMSDVPFHSDRVVTCCLFRISLLSLLIHTHAPQYVICTCIDSQHVFFPWPRPVGRCDWIVRHRL